MAPSNLPIPKPTTVAHHHPSPHLPPGTIDRIANLLESEKSKLALLFVPCSVSELYFAITEYAALVSPSDNPHPLFVDPRDRYEPAREDDSSDEDNDVRTYRRMRQLRQGIPIRGGKGTGKRTAHFPKYKLDLGDVTIIWPPPADFEAEQLASERDYRMTGRRRKSKSPPANHFTTEQDRQDAPVPDDQSDMDVTTDPISIHVHHYSVGQPRIDRMDRFVTYRELLLATTASTTALQDFAHEVMQWRIDKDHRDGGAGKFALYRFKTENCQGWWEDEGLKRARPVDSVVLADGQLSQIMKDVEKFLASSTRRWYMKHGLPHRRSFLFYGPPGTGKTSTIRAIASAFRLSCCYLSMTNNNFSNQMLADALSQIPPNALLILEDVDALFNLDRKSENAPSLTFSGLLNALDGVVSVDGVITILTTNHLERLDRALVRGGRVDRRFYFGHPDIAQLQDLFKVYYPKAESGLVKKFALKVMERCEGQEVRSISTLQQLFIQMREEDAEECVERMDEFFKAHFPGELSGGIEGLYV